MKVVVGLAVFGFWLLIVYRAFARGRTGAGWAGLSAPFLVAVVSLGALGSCLGGSGNCAVENTVGYTAVVIGYGMLVWAFIAAFSPLRDQADDSV